MEAKKREHVILFPYFGQGHLISFLALGLEIEKKRGCDVTLITTPLNSKHLRSSLPPSPSIRLHEIPFDSSQHGLPPNVDNVENLPPQFLLHFLDATASLKPGFRQAVSDITDESHSSFIIADIFFGWTAEIAREFGFFHSIYAGYSAFGIALYYSLWSNAPNWKVQGAHEFSNHDFPEGGIIHVSQLPASLVASDGTDLASVVLRKRLLEWRDTDAIIFNTIEEIDRQGLGYFNRKLGLPMYTIGPMITNKVRVTSHECLKWLATKPPTSVLYVCFGSQNTIAASQMMELAVALEASKMNFIWVVRPPLGIEPKTEFKSEEWLPKGFEDRAGDTQKGLLVRGWAPQTEILSHKSVGGFVSHCGWNSVVEAISHGVPILGWPIAAEQFFNAMFLERLGVGVELVRGNTCEVKNEDIAAKMEMLMGLNADAERLRRRTCEVRKTFEDAKQNITGHSGSSVRGMEEFLNTAMSYTS